MVFRRMKNKRGEWVNVGKVWIVGDCVGEK